MLQLTLVEALRTQRLPEFIAQEEPTAHGLTLEHAVGERWLLADCPLLMSAVRVCVD